MSVQSRIVAFAQSVGADIKLLLTRSVPAGGSPGQVLAKASASDYDTTWQTASAGGAGTAVYIQETDPLAMSPYIWFKTGPDGHVVDILKG
jgi:hypothetical protein